MESVLGKEKQDNYSHFYMVQMRIFWFCDGRQPLLATQLVCVRSTSMDVWDDREENKYHRKQGERVEK